MAKHRRFDAILFDVYGTLAEIGDKRMPFRQLLRLGEQQGRPIDTRDAATMMRLPLGLHEAAQRLGILLEPAQLAGLEADLHAEIASIRLFPDAAAILHVLHARGVKLGLCSNLAADYAAPIVALLPLKLDAYTWSFEAGAIKPDPAIYVQACRALDCAPGRVLMVGDTPTADVDGPRAVGMQSILLDRKQGRADANSLASLAGLLDML
jgi:HAD superfamily hydrolase (TIGR01509 family)